LDLEYWAKVMLAAKEIMVIMLQVAVVAQGL
jgi:hypothetical protein